MKKEEQIKFIDEKKKAFTEALGATLSDIGQLLEDNSDVEPYERVGWAIDSLSKMVSAFEQVYVSAYNLIDNIEDTRIDSKE